MRRRLVFVWLVVLSVTAQAQWLNFSTPGVPRTKDGKPWIAFGTPGADTQPQTQLQFFLNVVEFGLNVQEALEQPTVISNSFRDSYYPHDVKGKLLTPAMLSKTVQDALSAKGHQLDIRNVKGVGSVKAILIDPRTGVLMGGVSPTGDSYVMAW